MAKITSVGFDDLIEQFNAVANHSGAIASKALYAGAGLMADKIRSSADNLVTEPSRKHKTRELLSYEKEAIMSGLTVEKFTQDKARDYTKTAVTFHGRTNHRTARYPDGVPTILIARSINAGTTFRRANRWFLNTLNRNRKDAETLMVNTAEQELKQYIK